MGKAEGIRVHTSGVLEPTIPIHLQGREWWFGNTEFLSCKFVSCRAKKVIQSWIPATLAESIWRFVC
jgi:hypothetical protein